MVISVATITPYPLIVRRNLTPDDSHLLEVTAFIRRQKATRHLYRRGMFESLCRRYVAQVEVSALTNHRTRQTLEVRRHREASMSRPIHMRWRMLRCLGSPHRFDVWIG